MIQNSYSRIRIHIRMLDSVLDVLPYRVWELHIHYPEITLQFTIPLIKEVIDLFSERRSEHVNESSVSHREYCSGAAPHCLRINGEGRESYITEYGEDVVNAERKELEKATLKGSRKL